MMNVKKDIKTNNYKYIAFKKSGCIMHLIDLDIFKNTGSGNVENDLGHTGREKPEAMFLKILQKSEKRLKKRIDGKNKVCIISLH